MRLIGFNFDKISIEKLPQKEEQTTDKINITSNINIDAVNNIKQTIFKTKEDLLGVKFTYLVDYSPEIAKIEFKGNLVVGVDSKLAKETLKKWEEKQIPEDFKINIYNIIFKKANLKALQLEDEMNLPAHIQLPFIKKPEESQK